MACKIVISSFRRIALLCVASNFLWIAVIQGHDVCRTLVFQPPIDGSYLEGHVKKSYEIESKDTCELKCYMDNDCMSTNVGTLGRGKYLCELSDSDHELHPEDLKIRQGFTYTATKNFCINNRCSSNSRCQTGFTDRGYRCVCSAGFTGEDCDIVCPAVSQSSTSSASISTSVSPTVSTSLSTSASVSTVTSPGIATSLTSAAPVFTGTSVSASVSSSTSTPLIPSISLSITVSSIISTSLSTSSSGSTNVSAGFSISSSTNASAFTSVSISLSPSTSTSISTSALLFTSVSFRISTSLKNSASISTNMTASQSKNVFRNISKSLSTSASVSRNQMTASQSNNGTTSTPFRSQSVSTSASVSLSISPSKSSSPLIIQSASSSIEILGQHSTRPGDSCKNILDSGHSLGDGEYWIDPGNTGTPFKAYCDMTTDEGGWLLVTNVVADSSASFGDWSAVSLYHRISRYGDNRTRITKTAMNNLRTHLNFTQLRFHCSKQRGRTFHVTTVLNSTGEAVVQYFSGQTNVLPASCGSFQRMSDDNSQLSVTCDQWGNDGSHYLGKWGHYKNNPEHVLHNHAAFVASKNHWVITRNHQLCDDKKTRSTLSPGDFWKVYVR